MNILFYNGMVESYFLTFFGHCEVANLFYFDGPIGQGCGAGAEIFGRSRSWSRNKVSAPGETKSQRIFIQYGSGGQVTFKK
jgi:hypothetical protein